jgi:hypothetical protein
MNCLAWEHAPQTPIYRVLFLPNYSFLIPFLLSPPFDVDAVLILRKNKQKEYG